ncbi:helix-turn-helix transcriptional regulator [Streptomyces sp. ST2-7A]|uniref:helix-turn-helix domain-containing protein n=1 Tax=Streptomyces sp. ST2-7A TaxID=2907214 RepID=UPI001F441EC9|nr:helix-turn-helix transcriptional regulator [Streptomyces sp. ST2-7A]MCE7082858.1 helix-turn-helix transcriptional regulator [Streptomyces sp. ST2-7A]
MKQEVGALDESVSLDDFSQPPTPLQRFGADVRRVRLGRKLTQKQLGKAAGYSESYISQVESGSLPASEKFAKGCDLAFGTNGLFEGLLKRMGEGDHPSWFVPYLNLERRASRILDYSPNLVAGILQTERYAQEVFRTAHPKEDAEVIEGRVAARLRRRAIFEQPKPPELWVILHEGCLRTLVGGNEVMAEQLDHLTAAATSPGIDLQVLPFSAGAAAEHLMPYIMLTFDDRDAALYSEGPRGGRVYDSARTVAWGLDNYDRLRANALSLGKSMDLIKTLSKELRA